MAFKIVAKDKDDLTVISALLQDSIVARTDMTFLPGEQRFVMIVNRFRWEQSDLDDMLDDALVDNRSNEDASYLDNDKNLTATFSRVQSALRIENVEAAQTRNLEQCADSVGLLNILSVGLEQNVLLITLSNQAAIRLNLGQIACYLEDISEPWPSPSKPDHNDEDN